MRKQVSPQRGNHGDPASRLVPHRSLVYPLLVLRKHPNVLVPMAAGIDHLRGSHGLVRVLRVLADSSLPVLAIERLGQVLGAGCSLLLRADLNLGD